MGSVTLKITRAHNTLLILQASDLDSVPNVKVISEGPKAPEITHTLFLAHSGRMYNLKLDLWEDIRMACGRISCFSHTPQSMLLIPEGLTNLPKNYEQYTLRFAGKVIAYLYWPHTLGAVKRFGYKDVVIDNPTFGDRTNVVVESVPEYWKEVMMAQVTGITETVARQMLGIAEWKENIVSEFQNID
jgi:hypothetical protein